MTHMDLNAWLILAGMFVLPLLVVMIPIFLGQRYGMYQIKKEGELHQPQVSTVVGAAFGLLAFIMAFTFQIAANRYDARKKLLLDEVTNIRTTYLRADLVSEPYRSDMRAMIREYVDLRIELANDVSKLDKVMLRSQQILDSLWNTVGTITDHGKEAGKYTLFIASVNNLIDNYHQRITVTVEYQIPVFVKWILFFILFLSMLSLGYYLGITGKSYNRLSVLFAFIFALVMFLIMVLDHPETGWVQVNQNPMYTLQEELR